LQSVSGSGVIEWIKKIPETVERAFLQVPEKEKILLNTFKVFNPS